MGRQEKAINGFPRTTKRASARVVGQGAQPPFIPAIPSFKPEPWAMTFPSGFVTGGNMPSIRDFIHGMTNHFRLRASAWIMSLITTLYGVVLLNNPVAFDIPSRPFQYLYLLRIMSQHHWGIICLCLGSFRLCALIVNGTFPSFVWSPHIRVVGSFCTVFVWFQILFGTFHSATLNLALPAYLAFFLFDVFNVYIAALEIERPDN